MAPTTQDVRIQLDRVLASEAFANADRMSAFLRFVVEQSLAGEGDRVKEYVIGVEVFGRGETYDPRLDSIVRVEARRLRTKLDEYYAREGGSDPILIRIPRGAYVPTFEWRNTSENGSGPSRVPESVPRLTRRPWRLALGLGLTALLLGAVAVRSAFWSTSGASTSSSIAVLPFAEYSADGTDRLLAARLTDGVTSALAVTGLLGVVSHTSAMQAAAGTRRPAPELGRALNADILMEATVSRSGDRVDVEVRLVDAVSDRKFWVERFTGSAQDPRELEGRIARAAAPAALDARNRTRE